MDALIGKELPVCSVIVKSSTTPGGEAMEQRELTRKEKAAIRSLVTRWCANYDRDYGLSLIHI